MEIASRDKKEGMDIRRVVIKTEVLRSFKLMKSRLGKNQFLLFIVFLIRKCVKWLVFLGVGFVNMPQTTALLPGYL